MSALTVYLNGERVGRLEQDESGLLDFAYDPSWLEKMDAVPLSRSLPLRAESFPGKKARPFFAGILPEEEPRKQIAGILGISHSNDFAMLERIGGECAGAVSLLPEGVAPPIPQKARHRTLTDREMQKIVKELPRRPLMVGTDGLRLSLAGAQDKLPLIFMEEAFHLPLDGTPSTHILKPEPERFPGLAANEYFCMTLARSVGLNTPDMEYIRIGGKPCVLIQRFDRKMDAGGRMSRIHQEDFCQALGVPPERKYQAEGGPTVRDCISLLREWSTAPVLDVPAFIAGLIFNVMIGNADAHAKNYSLLYVANERRLAPFYDLVCTLAWPELSKTPAMKIGGGHSINTLSPGDWNTMTKNAGLGWPLIREKMIEIGTSVMNQLGSVLVHVESHDVGMAKRLHDLVEARCAKLIKALSKPA